MNASHDLSDSVDRTRLVKSGGARDAKQGDTIRVDGMCPRGRGQGSVSECSKHEAKPLNESAAECTTKDNDVNTTRLPGNDESLMISEESS